MFGKIRIDPNDTLYSKIIRFSGLCARCGRAGGKLQCAHIIGRKHKTTRWMLEPVRNAVALCFACHAWLDEHKIKALVFDPSKRVLSADDEAYTFLVERCGYTWEDLQLLFVFAQRPCRYGPFEKSNVKKYLMAKLRELESKQQIIGYRRCKATTLSA